jgi:2-methylisocitrate lyase-like PEP mutase family enzyme
MNPSSSRAISRFRELHESGCFVVPNPWDVGTALYLEHLGFQALATTSAGLAFSKGLPDALGAVSRDETLAHLRDIVAAVSLPVNADFQSGFADGPREVAIHVSQCVATGVAGLSIEDATGKSHQPLYERTLAVERIQAARAAIDATNDSVVLTGRCEAWLVSDANPLRTALDRLVAYAEAGADCLYAPGVREPQDIQAIVRAVAPKPVNVLVSSSEAGLSVSRLAALGVRRISVGSALARTAWGAFMRAARGMIEAGSFDGLAEAAGFADVNQVFRGRYGGES